MTATVHIYAGHAASLLPVLAQKAGRIVVNGWPIGVEVCHAMVHGEPFPATSDSRTTSVARWRSIAFFDQCVSRICRKLCCRQSCRMPTRGVLPGRSTSSARRRRDGRGFHCGAYSVSFKIIIPATGHAFG